MIVKMTLISDTIFGSGASVPGAEDISILCDRNGFPYYKGGTFKGIFREEMERLLKLRGETEKEIHDRLKYLLGQSGNDRYGKGNIQRRTAEDIPEKTGDDEKDDGRIIFSDFCISQDTKKKTLDTAKTPHEVTEVTTNLRTFTAIDDSGIAKKGSLRMARCVDRGLSFYSRIECPDSEKDLVEETLGMIKWVGSMRNRGFGRVRITPVPDAEQHMEDGNKIPDAERHMEDGNMTSDAEQRMEEENKIPDAEQHMKEDNKTPDAERDTEKGKCVSAGGSGTEGKARQTRYIRYELQNIEPLRIADDSTSQRGQTSTLKYIPGTTIRGYVINRLAKESEFDLEGEKRLLFSEHVRFMDCSLQTDKFMDCSLQSDKCELLPPLKGFYEDKKSADENGEKIIENVTKNGLVTDGNKRASLGNACRIDRDTICFYQIETGSDMKIHIKLKDKNDKQNVFRSEYILPGCSFAGYIAFDEPAFSLEKAVFSALGKEECMTLGNARSSGMGRCRIRNLSEIDPEEYCRIKSLPQKPVENEIYMILLSHTVMRDHNGKYCGLNIPELEEKMGVSDLRVMQCSTSVVDVRGYNSQLQLKTPSVTMYERGSVFHLSFSGSIDPEALRLIAQQGIGVRRNEGFGQVTFAGKEEYEKIARKREAGSIYTDAEGINIKDDEETCRIIARNYLRRKLRKYFDIQIIDVSDKGFAGRVSESQKGSVRALLLANRYDFGEAGKSIEKYFAHAREKQENQNVHKKRSDVSSLSEFVNSTLKKKADDIIPEVMGTSYTYPDADGIDEIMGFPAASLITDEEFGRMKIDYILDLFEYDNRKKA